VNGVAVMSLSNSWRIARNTPAVYSRMILENLPAKEEAAAEKGATEDLGRTDNTEANRQTR
jgi:hypothetical protein